MSKNNCIGAFDSGVGGLSVLKELVRILPDEDFVYLADQANVPYGKRTHEEVRQFSERITRFLLGKGAKIIVIPCNTATGAALEHLRKTFPDTPFVGMEPAVKPAAEQSKTRKIGVLATAGTFKSQRYSDLIEKYGHDLKVLENPCIGLVELIESGKKDSFETRDFLQKIIDPMKAENIDTIVLGCTHYPFIRPILEELFSKEIKIIDPAPAVARHVKYRLEMLDLINENKKRKIRFYTTGNVKNFKLQISELTGIQGLVKGVRFA